MKLHDVVIEVWLFWTKIALAGSLLKICKNLQILAFS